MTEQPSSDETTLRHFKTVLWQQAYRNGDVDLLERLLHDSFEMIDADGNRSDKQDELDYVRDNTWDPGAFEYQIERLQIFNDNYAIVAGRGLATEFSYRSSNVLVKEEGEWRAVMSHVSGVTSYDDEE